MAGKLIHVGHKETKASSMLIQLPSKLYRTSLISTTQRRLSATLARRKLSRSTQVPTMISAFKKM